MIRGVPNRRDCDWMPGVTVVHVDLSLQGREVSTTQAADAWWMKAWCHKQRFCGQVEACWVPRRISNSGFEGVEYSRNVIVQRRVGPGSIAIDVGERGLLHSLRVLLVLVARRVPRVGAVQVPFGEDTVVHAR